MDIQKLLETYNVSLILLNLCYVCNDCIPILKTIKSKNPSIPIIFIGSCNNSEIIIKAFRFGARDYFPKPFSFSDINKTISKILHFTQTNIEKREVLLEGDLSNKYFTTSIPKKIYNAIIYVKDNYHKENLCLSDASMAACMSNNHFSRTFKKFTGTSFSKFLNLTRISYAKEKLRNQELSITEIALDSGYNDLSYFDRIFLKYTGQSPSEYRAGQRTANRNATL